MSVNSFFACPTDCSTSLLYPALAADAYCEILPIQSEISYLFIRPKVGTTLAASPFTNWGSSMTVNATGIDNTNTDNTKSRLIIIIGEVQAPEKQTYLKPLLKEGTFLRTYTLTGTITSIDTTMYNFLRSLQCGRTDNFTFYYGNRKYIFGKADGIVPSSIDVEFLSGKGKESFFTANIIIKWESNTGDPDIAPNVYA